jgi:AcrR family transcriptional regulator
VLDAAIEVSGERGYDGSTMSMIAKRADVSMSSIYWHFSSKDELLAAVIQRSFDAWERDVVTWSEPPPGTTRRDHLAALMAHDVVALTRNPDFLRLGLMLSLERRPVEPAARARYLELRQYSLEQLARTFQRLAADAGLTTDDALCAQLATLAMAAADGLFIAAQIDPAEADLLGTCELLVGALLDRITR